MLTLSCLGGRIPARTRPRAPIQHSQRVSRMTGDQVYDRVADEAAAVVIRRYSTSFGLASRLLGAEVRQPVENIYALVRIADELVDGSAKASGLDLLQIGQALTALEAETALAIELGF